LISLGRKHNGKQYEERGGYLLRYTGAPCVIAEPFFIDNDQDLKKAQQNIVELAGAYANAFKKISDLHF